MKKSHIQVLAFLLLILVLSCKDSKSQNRRSLNDQEIITKNYSLVVPNDFKRTNNINELAEVQFQKIDEDLYFIVLEQTKQSFENGIKLGMYDDTTTDLNGYFKVVTENFKEITKDLKISGVGVTKINSCNAIIFSMSGESLREEKNVFYRYALIEDEKNFYQIMSWTNIHYKEKLIGRMDNIIFSFKPTTKH